MSLVAWVDQPLEEARLLNPAFLGAIVWACTEGYGSETAKGLPYALAFVALPVVLHRPTRDTLPSGIRSSLPLWLSDNPRALVGFAERASSLVPAVKAALLFASKGGLLSIADGRLIAQRRPKVMKTVEAETTDEVRQCFGKGRFVGRWFARAGNVDTVMALWGVAP